MKLDLLCASWVLFLLSFTNLLVLLDGLLDLSEFVWRDLVADVPGQEVHDGSVFLTVVPNIAKVDEYAEQEEAQWDGVSSFPGLLLAGHVDLPDSEPVCWGVEEGKGGVFLLLLLCESCGGRGVEGL